MSFPSVATPTSEAAAEQVNPTKAKVLREKVFQVIVNAGDEGVTDEEIQSTLNLAGNTERPRRWELSHKEGRIQKAGTRLTKTGRQANVWVANAYPTPVVNKPIDQVGIKTWWAQDDDCRTGPFFTKEEADAAGVTYKLPETVMKVATAQLA